MTIQQTRHFNRLTRSLEFLQARDNEFESGSKATSLRDELQGVIATIKETRNTPRKRGISTPKLAVLNALRADINRVSRTAQMIAADKPGFGADFEVPDMRRKEELVNSAREFLKKAQKNKNLFAQWEMRDAFFQQMQENIEAYERIAAEKPRPANAPRRASDEASTQLERGTQIVDSLDVIMSNKYANTDELLTWKEASTLERGTRRRKNADA